MRIARDQDEIVRCERREDHCLNGGGRAIDEEDRVIGMPEIGGELLCVHDASAGGVEIVEFFHERDFAAETGVGNELAEEFVRAESLLMSGRVKCECAVGVVIAHGVCERCGH